MDFRLIGISTIRVFKRNVRMMEVDVKVMNETLGLYGALAAAVVLTVALIITFAVAIASTVS